MCIYIYIYIYIEREREMVGFEQLMISQDVSTG